MAAAGAGASMGGVSRINALRPSFAVQAGALIRKNAIFQYRQCCLNICLVASAVIIPIILLIVQRVITNILDTPANRCGCLCTVACPDAGGACRSVSDPLYGDLTQTPNNWLPQYGAQIQDANKNKLVAFAYYQPASAATYTCQTFDSGNCAIGYSFTTQIYWCPIVKPNPLPPMAQMSYSQYRWQYEGCNDTVSQCPAVIPYTATNSAAGSLLTAASIPTAAQVTAAMGQDTAVASLMTAYNALLVGTGTKTALAAAVTAVVAGSLTTAGLDNTIYNLRFGLTMGSAFHPPTSFSSDSSFSNSRLFYLMQDCANFAYSGLITSLVPNGNVSCVNVPFQQVTSSDAINTLTYNGYYINNNPASIQSHDITAAFDFYDTAVLPGGSVTASKLHLDLFYNKTLEAQGSSANGPPPYTDRVFQPMNRVTNAYLQAVLGSSYGMPLKWIKDMPKVGSKLNIDLSSLIGKIFYTWMFQLLFPVWTSMLVYEKEMNLRTMMKMQGLGDISYWLINYLYYLIMWLVYMWLLIAFGSAVGLSLFRNNSYGIQFVFFFLYGNMQIALSFLSSTFYSKAANSVIVNVLYVLVGGLMGEFLFELYLQSPSFSRQTIFVMELIPPFGLYRGLYELGEYAFQGIYTNSNGGMQASNLSDAENGMTTMWAIFAVEWAVFLIFALYFDQIIPSGTGVHKHPLFFLEWLGIRVGGDRRALEAATSALGSPSADLRGLRSHSLTTGGTSAAAALDMESPEVAEERALVESITAESFGDYSIVARGLQKYFPPRGGRAGFMACRSLHLAIPRGECFGMLGPNGAGKSTSINMLVGFLAPTRGTALIEGLDITRDMDAIYKVMGVCPQHDLLWHTLTAREHLYFYGRLKNLRGAELDAAVNSLLRKVNLFNGGVGDKRCGEYSGGMRRRLSVAISLIGNPLVVYMDEPSTGLDPASRRNLWAVIKEVKKDRAIVLTTHSMEEAEVLCDRLGIFVDGQLQTIGNPKQLTSRFGAFLIFTLAVPPAHEARAAEFVAKRFPTAVPNFALAGTLKYDLPSADVKLADVFAVMEAARSELEILDWGVANMTLEEVFIKISKATMSEDVQAKALLH